MLPATFFVNNNNPNGLGSLKQAIIDANELPGGDDVRFNIPGPGPHTIQPIGALPRIYDPVVIDGTTQPGYAGKPLIELNGSLAGIPSGLTITGGNSTIRGLVINGFAGAAVEFSQSSNSAIEACYIGTDIKGQFPRPNNLGVYISRSGYNRIGGTQSGVENLISGNTFAGVYVENSRSNTIVGNFLGTDVSGFNAVGNGAGIYLFDSASNTIGGTLTSERNIVSGNRNSGIEAVSSEDNIIQGNYVGTDRTGTSALPNSSAGVSLAFSARKNVVGGTAVGAGNLISGNRGHGVNIAAQSSLNVVAGNLIGTDVTGRFAIPNGLSGVSLFNQSSNNFIGGSTPGSGNVISGNLKSGISFGFNTGGGYVVQGNLIGTTREGDAALGNGGYGINVSECFNALFGGTVSLARNVISGNGLGGISFSQAGDNRVEGNFIGTDINGTVAIGNHGHGITFGSITFNNVVGGTALVGSDNVSRNVISGNTGDGIFHQGGNNTHSNLVQGNFIGTDAAGKKALGNKGNGVSILSETYDNVIGGMLVINGIHAARNIISGNGEAGVRMTKIGSIFPTGNVVQGNYIGSDVTGTRAVGNGGDGVMVFQSIENTIGGTEAGAANFIAYNGGDGFSVTDGGSIGVRGNTFFANANLGIQLVNNGNRRQAAPDLDTVISHGSSTMISGSLQSTPDTDFALEFFSSAACDPSGFGEGEEFFRSASVTTSAGGRVRFQFIFNTALTPGRVVTATATDPRNNTSEFSACQTVTTPVPLPNGPTRAAAAVYFSGVFPIENAPFRKTTSETTWDAPRATDVGLRHTVYLPDSKKPAPSLPRPITLYRATLPTDPNLTGSVWEDVLPYFPNFV